MLKKQRRNKKMKFNYRYFCSTIIFMFFISITVFSQDLVKVIYDDYTESINNHLTRFKVNEELCLDNYTYNKNLFELFYYGNDSINVKVNKKIVFSGKTNDFMGLHPQLLFSFNDLNRCYVNQIEIDFLEYDKKCIIKLNKKYNSIIITPEIDLVYSDDINLINQKDTLPPKPVETISKSKNMVEVILMTVNYKNYEELLNCSRRKK